MEELNSLTFISGLDCILCGKAITMASKLTLTCNWNGNDKTNIINLADSCTFQLSHLSFFPKSSQCTITSSHMSLCSNLLTAHILFSVPSQITLFLSTFFFMCERFLFVKLLEILWLFWSKMEKLVELFKIPGERKTTSLSHPAFTVQTLMWGNAHSIQ